MEEAKRRGKMAMKSDNCEVLVGGLTLENKNDNILPRVYVDNDNDVKICFTHTTHARTHAHTHTHLVNNTIESEAWAMGY